MKLFFGILLLSGLALANTNVGNDKQAGRSTNSKVIKADLKGLSAFVSMEFADTFYASGTSQNQAFSGDFGAERAFGFGALYTAAQLENGLELQGGASFDTGRVLSNFKSKGQVESFTGNKPEVQLWLLNGQARAHLSENFSVYGGGNYSFPQTRNITGGSFSGQLGYQIGATFALNSQINVDGEYRTVNFKGTVSDQGESVAYDNIGIQGFNVKGRYSF